MGLAMLGGLTPAAFLRRHWQKRPLLVRQAFPGFRDPLGPDEIKALSCDPGVESRLVMERGGATAWQLTPGPQDPRRLRRMPGSHWTLLVQSVDAHVPEAARLLEEFAFVPGWRRDDVMASYAPPGGSVGPHVDGYDVFLIQGRGRRRWRVGTGHECIPGLDLRVLRDFRASQDWVLETGDMLYLPPGVAHHGVAVEHCLTWSIGFRAPSEADLVMAWLKELTDQLDREALFRDPDLVPPRHPGEIGPRALYGLQRVVERAAGRVDRDRFARLAGALLTEPRAPISPPRVMLTPTAVRHRLAAGHLLHWAPGARLAWVREGSRAVLFANGEAVPLEAALAWAAPLLADSRWADPRELARHRSARFETLIARLVNAGALALSPPAGGGGRRGSRAAAESEG